MTRRRMIPLAVFAFSAIIAAFGFWRWWRAEPAAPVHTLTKSSVQPVDEETSTEVVLSQEEAEAAGVRVDRVEKRWFRVAKQVPGRVRHDETRHVEVRVPTSGILSEVRVQVGDVVKKGDVLAIASSPELAEARAEVLKLRDRYQRAERDLRWERDTQAGVTKLIQVLSEEPELEELNRVARELLLGTHREELISAYARLHLSRRLASNTESIRGSGAVSKRLLEERRNELASAEAALQGIMEQTGFDSRRDLAMAETAARDARRRLRISENHVRTLLGYEGSVEISPSEEDRLAIVEVRAPIDGAVQERDCEVAGRLEPDKILFVLADTSQVWVAADVRDGEWQAVDLKPGQEVQIACPALPDHAFQGIVRFVGSEVDRRSRAVPIVAVVNNADGRLRPGQYVRVTLPCSGPREVLAVPASAIAGHDGKQYLFTQVDPLRFRPVEIEVGDRFEGWVEVQRGVLENDPIVVEGTFFCKSEWLLSQFEE